MFSTELPYFLFRVFYFRSYLSVAEIRIVGWEGSAGAKAAAAPNRAQQKRIGKAFHQALANPRRSVCVCRLRIFFNGKNWISVQTSQNFKFQSISAEFRSDCLVSLPSCGKFPAPGSSRNLPQLWEISYHCRMSMFYAEISSILQETSRAFSNC